MPKENKFINYLAFKQALYKALFQHLIGAAVVGATESLPVVGPVNLVLPPGDIVLVINNLDTKDRAELAATVAVVYIAGKMLVTAIVNLFVEHQRVSIKRTSCVIYKQATKEEKRGFRELKSYIF